jgi:hypothetical protein
MPADEVSLTDLTVIQRYSVAVRVATAPVDEVVAALRADLEHLTGSAAPAATARPRARRTAARAPEA